LLFYEKKIAQTFRKICKGKCYVLVGLACFDTLESVDGDVSLCWMNTGLDILLYLSVKLGYISAQKVYRHISVTNNVNEQPS